MLNLVKRSLSFMTRRERIKYFLFLIIKSLVGLLDLVAIMAIGLLSSSIVTALRTGGNPKPVELGPLTLPGIDSRSIPALGLFILFLFILKALISILLTHKLAHSLARIEARAAKRIATNVFGDGLDGVTRYSKNEILYIVQFGSPSAFNTLLNAVGTLSTEGFLFVLVIGAFTAISPWAALGALLYFGAIGFLIQHYIGRRVQQTSQIITESSIKSSSGILDLSEVIREVSTLQKKAFFLDRIYEARMDSARNMATQLVLQGTPRHIVETALIVGIATFIFLQSLSGDLSEAAVTIGVFLAGGLRLTAALLPLQGALLSINRCQPAAELALKALEDSTVEIHEDLQPSDQTDSARAVEIRIEGLNFSYTGADNVIENVFMKIPAGSQAAFIGPSGAGKSTLADLILGLLRPSSGEVFMDDLDIVEWIDKNPGSVGYVPQKPGMVSGTIRENIALGLPQKDVDTQKLNKAISDAHLTALIDSLPEGIETDVGKHKDELSGGQIQRIGLARALYSEPSLLIMDEATSALDAESENEINKALTRMRGKVTVILIAHRLNTVQRSDVVFLIEQGNVTASGTFPELLKSNSTVRKLAALMAIESPDQSKPSE